MSDEKDDDYLFDKTGKPEPEIAELEKMLGSARYVPPRENRVDRRSKARAPAALSARRFPLVVTPLALAATVLLALAYREWNGVPQGPSLAVTRTLGTPRVDERSLGATGRLGVGKWLETDQTSGAEIELRDIGKVAVGPKSRVRLVAIAPTEQRLELERGVIEAHVRAVPRLFVVDTPSARATDLGCAYRLEVTSDGGTLLHVTSGAVELAGEGRQAHVPAGAFCATKPKRGPGCPYFDDASPAFKRALGHMDFDLEPDAVSLDTLLAQARVRDTLTLWQLIWRVAPTSRAKVLARVMELVPPPSGVDLGSSDPAAFQRYQDHLMTFWTIPR
jgi:hypothetical protein